MASSLSHHAGMRDCDDKRTLAIRPVRVTLVAKHAVHHNAKWASRVWAPRMLLIEGA